MTPLVEAKLPLVLVCVWVWWCEQPNLNRKFRQCVVSLVGAEQIELGIIRGSGGETN